MKVSGHWCGCASIGAAHEGCAGWASCDWLLWQGSRWRLWRRTTSSASIPISDRLCVSRNHTVARILCPSLLTSNPRQRTPLLRTIRTEEHWESVEAKFGYFRKEFLGRIRSSGPSSPRQARRMRASWWIGIWATFLSSTVRSIETAPFSAPEQAESNKRAFEVLQLLKRADNNCPSGYNACTSLGNSEACCKKGSNCSRDAANNIACCPTGASCTGSLTASGSGGSKTGSSFMFPQDATATTTAADATASHPGSTIDGAYPFIYVPTTFSDAATCSSYYSQCQSQYTQCNGALMGRYGVTIGGGGAGMTVEAVTATSQATSICSRLSAEACHGLGLGYCGTVETGTAHDTQGNAAAPGRASLHDLMLGLAVGVAGMFV